MIHYVKMKLGRTMWMTIKIELNKTYECLNWCFIKGTLKEIDFLSSLVYLIWNCISSSKMCVLWNNKALEEFHSIRGIR